MSRNDFIAEARRRKVFRTAGIYVVGAAGVWGAAEVAVEALGMPTLTLTFVVVSSIVGFPFALVLSWFYQLTADDGSGTEPAAGDAAAARPAPPLSKAIAVGLTTAIVGFVGLAATVSMRSEAPAGGTAATVVPFTRTQITYVGSAMDPVFSPDGRHVAFRASQVGETREGFPADTLMVMELGGSPRSLLGVRSHRQPFTRVLWSADGAEVWFTDMDSTLTEGVPISLYAVPMEGGERRKVMDGFGRGSNGRSAEELLLPSMTDAGLPAVMTMDLSTGARSKIPLDEPGLMPLALALDGERSRLAVVLAGPRGDVALWSVSLDGDHPPQRLDAWNVPELSRIPGVAWGDHGKVVYYDRVGRLWRLAVDPASGAPLGEGVFTGHDLTGGFTVSPDGQRLVLENRLGGQNLWIYPLDGDTLRPPGRRLTRGTFRRQGYLSPDGTRIAMLTREGPLHQRASILDRQTGTEHTLTTTNATDMAWSPDGAKLAFVGSFEGGYRVFTVEADGSGQRLLDTPPVEHTQGVWWCAHRGILVPTREADQLVLADPGGGPTRPLELDLGGTPQILFPVCSPDGSEVAFVLAGLADRPAGVYAADLNTGDVRSILENPLVVPGQWTRDGRILGGDADLSANDGTHRGFVAHPSIEGVIFMSGQVGPGGDFMLVEVPEPESSDLYLIDYGEPGGGG